MTTITPDELTHVLDAGHRVTRERHVLIFPTAGRTIWYASIRSASHALQRAGIKRNQYSSDPFTEQDHADFENDFADFEMRSL